VLDKHFHERAAGPQISPLRSFGAPVEMTKGRAALPLSGVAEQNPFFITLGAAKAHDFSGRKTFPGKDRWNADLSTALLRSSGRDDKGESGASIEYGCRTEPSFHHLGWADGPYCSGRKTFPGKDRWNADLSTALRFGRDDKGSGGASSKESLLKRSHFAVVKTAAGLRGGLWCPTSREKRASMPRISCTRPWKGQRVRLSLRRGA
jgi:hypothetical protein